MPRAVPAVRPGPTAPPVDAVAPRRGLRAALVGLGATVVVALGVTGPSLWTDEAATISAARRPLGELGRMARELDAVHTVYYALMHAWTSVAGTSELALRAPSAVAVGLAAAATYLLGARLGGERLGLWAAVTLALLPRASWAGIEARPFALATAAGAWATLALVLAVRDRRARWWVAHGLLVALAVAVNLYLVLLVAAHAVSLWPDRRRVRDVVVPWLVSAGAGVLAAAPVALLALGQSGQLGENRPGPLGLARNVVVNQWFLGETPTVYSRTSRTVLVAAPPWWSPDALWRPASVLLALVAVAVVVVGGRALLRGRIAPGADVARWAGPWLLVPTVVLVAWSFVSGTYSPRYTTFATPALALVLAAALLALRPRVRWVAVVLLVALALPVLVSQRLEHAKSGADWREVAAHVAAGAEAGDGVYFAPRHPEGADDVRLTTRGVAVAYPEAFDDLVDVTLRVTPVEAADLTGRSYRLEDAPRLDDVDRLWVVRRHDYPEGARASDAATLEAAGFVEVGLWSGPLDEVVELVRE